MKTLTGIIIGATIILTWQHNWRPWLIALFARGD